MVDSKAKGSRAETTLRDILRKETGLQWEKTPGSGALDARYGLKGDLYIPNAMNNYCVEVKAYKESSITHNLLGAGSTNLDKWWEQATRQAKQVSQIPILFFKHDRSKWYVGIELIEPPTCVHLYYSKKNIFIILMTDFLATTSVKWT